MNNAICVITALICFVASGNVARASTMDQGTVSKILAGNCAGMAAQLQPSADGGDVKALEALAVLYERGCGVPQDMSTAETFFERAVAGGNTDPLAVAYVDVYRVGSSQRGEAVAVLKKAAEAGDFLCARDLADYYLNWVRGDSDPLQFHWYEVASRGGDLDARAMLARDYGFGNGVKTDVSRAERLLHEALAAGGWTADVTSAAFAQFGLPGSAPNPRLAQQRYKTAIAKGSALAKLFFIEALVPTDYASGRYSVSATDAIAETGVRRLLPRFMMDAFRGAYYFGFYGRPPSYGKAIPLLKASDIAPLTLPDELLGVGYANGYGVKANFAEVIKYEKEAAARGSTDAAEYLKKVAREEALDANATASGGGNDSYAHASMEYEREHWNENHPTVTLPMPGSPAYPQH